MTKKRIAVNKRLVIGHFMNRNTFRFSLISSLIVAVLSPLNSVLAEDNSISPDVLFIVVDDMNDWISLLDPES